MNSDRLLVVLDVDSTLTRDEGIDLLASYVSPEVEAEVAAITAAAMRGELDFVQSLRKRVGALKGVPADTLGKVAAKVTITPGAQKLIETLHSHGHLVGVVSGGFHEMVDPLAKGLGIDFVRANRLGVINSSLTGQLEGPIIDAQAKSDALHEWARESDISMSHTVAIGDGGNDVIMLRDAGLGIAFMAKPVARAAADLAIDTPDLSQILDLLGFV
jgi:phosphoserine phosphatase